MIEGADTINLTALLRLHTQSGLVTTFSLHTAPVLTERQSSWEKLRAPALNADMNVGKEEPSYPESRGGTSSQEAEVQGCTHYIRLQRAG